MKYEEIHEMLDRYWEGETTLEEERRIKTYFNSGGIDERLRPIAALFQAMREEQTVQLTNKAKAVSIRPQMYQWAVAASVALLLAAGWWMFRGENPRATMAIETPTEVPKTIQSPMVETPQKSLAMVEQTTNKPILPPKKSPAKRDKPRPTIDPETAQAMAEIKAALALVSSKLDKGRSEAVKGATYLDAMEKVPRRKAG
jgi:hypothetical protein